MNKWLVFSLLSLLSCEVFAQRLGPTDTLNYSNRTFGSNNDLLHIMDGFSSSYFFQPQQTSPTAIDVLQPGLSCLSSANLSDKPMIFSALPHLGFGYGFGAQGSQVLRLDYEQSFDHHALLNLRYDRWQRIGFIRSDELRFSGLQMKLHQRGKAHEFQISFDNASDDRQWAGGIADYSQLGTIALDLIPILKTQSYTQKNKYTGQIDFRYKLVGDSIKGLSFASFHAYQFQQRIYNEIGNLALLYPQTFLNSDTCTDTFRQVYLENRIGLSWSGPSLSISSLIGIKQRQWQDPILNYDTLELNLNNQLSFQNALHNIKHENKINIVGAGQGVYFNSSYRFGDANSRLCYLLKHRLSNEWPTLIQRAYASNLTNYAWSEPQKENLHQMVASVEYRVQNCSIALDLSLAKYQSVYRFDMSTMNWNANAVGSSGKFASLNTQLKYQLGALKFNSSYQFLAQKSGQFLPKHKANLSVQWSRGVFKDQRLQMVLEGNVSYQSRFQALVFLPFIESLDWSATQNSMFQTGFVNAQLGVALEVKTFRFFMNVANLGSFWNEPALAVVQGYPFAPMQLRIGLTWDFWN
ncbi:MAG: putative porin [Flavobacteriales bacterium]